MAGEILHSWKAYDKFKQIIKAQEGSLNNIQPAKTKHDILSRKSGKILEIDNKKIALLARITGCPADKFSGLYIYYHVGDKVKKGDNLITIYSESKSRLKQAVKFYKEKKPIKIK